MKSEKFCTKLGWVFSLFLVATMSSVFLSSEMLSAAHTVRVKGINNAKIVETVVPEPEVVAKVERVAVRRPVAVVKPVASAAVVQPTVSEFTIDNVIRTLKILENPNYTNIYKTGKLYYGHNSSNLLGGLKNLKGGDKILAEGRTYTVVTKVTYLKTTLANEPGVLNTRGNLMADVMLSAYNAENGATYDIAVMTCAGQSYGNGDASHRLVVYANLD